MAWLHSTPKRHAKEENPKARIDTLIEGSPSKNLPEINGYLSLCFQLSGICLTGSMGIIPLTWSEVSAFSNQSGYTLTGWESEQIIKMSRAYCQMSFNAAKIGCPPPYQEGIDDEEAVQKNRERVNKQWDSFSSNLKVK